MELKSSAGQSAELDNTDWFRRSEYWRTYEPKKLGRGAVRKFKYREPLVLCGHGIGIRVDYDTLVIRGGFTHYPQKQDQFRLFPGDGNLPDRIIILDADGVISFDALNWMSEQKIELIQINWRGDVVSVAGNSGYSANPKIVARQLALRGTKIELEIARTLIREKLRASVETLKSTCPKSEGQQEAISDIGGRISKIEKLKSPFTRVQLFGIEGPAAQAYFRAWYDIPLNWTTSARRPIPESWRKIGPRKMPWKKRSRAAPHPTNAMLNYGYGILKNKILSHVIANGLDPTIGILHGNSQNTVPLVYDFMEPYRPVVDRTILEFALSQTFAPGDFTISKWGGCRLNPQLAKTVATHTSKFDTAPMIGLLVQSIMGRSRA